MRISRTVMYLFFSFILFINQSYAATLKDYSYAGEFTADQAKTAVAKLPPLNNLDMNYNLKLYIIHYYTPDPAGNATLASGLVAMPENTSAPVSMVTYMHGTRFNRDDVPSRIVTRDAANYAVFGSHAGYMVVLPDYLGLGDSTLPLHPYVLADSLATTSINMLIAAKELAAELHYAINDKLFLTGYSEGGFTTNVTYEKLLQEHPEIKVTAVSPGSAPYDWATTMQFLLKDPGPRATGYLAFFMYSAQTYTHYWNSLDDIFAAPYNTLIPQLFDGKHQTQDILDSLPKDPYQICQPGFLQGILNGTDIHSAQLLKNFNHIAYQPTSPMLIVGTKGDHDVPYAGEEMAYHAFKEKSNDVFLESVSDTLDHIQAYPVVTLEQLKFFQQYDH